MAKTKAQERRDLEKKQAHELAANLEVLTSSIQELSKLLADAQEHHAIATELLLKKWERW